MIAVPVWFFVLMLLGLGSAAVGFAHLIPMLPSDDLFVEDSRGECDVPRAALKGGRHE
jgi:hypothetical protein